MRTHLHAKGLAGTRGDEVLKNIFLFSVCIIKDFENASPRLNPLFYKP